MLRIEGWIVWLSSRTANIVAGTGALHHHSWLNSKLQTLAV
jgi:hypothetical protein